MIFLINIRTAKSVRRLSSCGKSELQLITPQLAKKTESRDQQADQNSKNSEGGPGETVRVRGRRKVCNLSGR